LKSAPRRRESWPAFHKKCVTRDLRDFKPKQKTQKGGGGGIFGGAYDQRGGGESEEGDSRGDLTFEKRHLSKVK